MGMDVVGRNNPDAYFRNNVWWWRPLWDYCCEVAPVLCEDVNGHFNDGDGLDEDGALELAKLLKDEIYSGKTLAYETAYNKRISELPRHKCKYCDGTGTRTDAVGIENGMHKRELEAHIAVLTGRTHGWCNACAGEGMVDDFEAGYPFTVDNVLEFVDFLEDCGGFHIY